MNDIDLLLIQTLKAHSPTIQTAEKIKLQVTQSPLCSPQNCVKQMSDIFDAAFRCLNRQNPFWNPSANIS